MSSSLRIAILHSNMTIGGAERLLLDMEKCLQNNGHVVHFFTTNHQKSHCFSETLDGSVKIDVVTEKIPFTIFHRFFRLMAALKMILMTLWVLLFGPKFDVYLVDQISIVLPLLWIFRKRTIFYIHFPEKLLWLQKANGGKQIYRKIFNFIEEISLMFASKILVNSNFTKNAYDKAYPILKHFNKEAEVLYPAIDIQQIHHSKLDEGNANLEAVLPKGIPFFLSLNRFQPIKKVHFVIECFAKFRSRNPESQAHLVLAGGYDPDCKENVEYLLFLEEHSRNLGVDKWTLFLRNIDNHARLMLSSSCICLCFTPENEHFGIIPIEVMSVGRPVLAHNSGGPRETVSEDSGFLLEYNALLWSDKMEFLWRYPKAMKEMGKNAKKRVEDFFSMNAFSNHLNEIINSVM